MRGDLAWGEPGGDLCLHTLVHRTASLGGGWGWPQVQGPCAACGCEHRAEGALGYRLTGQAPPLG